MKTRLIQLQVPEELRQKLRELADADRRSMTAEAVWILEREVERRLADLSKSQIDIPTTDAEREAMMGRMR